MVNSQQGSVLKRSRSRQILVQIIVGSIILVSGVIIGSGGTILLAKHKVIWISYRRKADQVSIAKKISSRYGLDDRQTRQVEDIFREGFQKKELIHKQMSEEMDARRQVLVAKMKEVLSPAQFEKWHEDLQIRMEKRKKRHR